MHYQTTNYDLLCQLLQSIPEGDGCMEWPRYRIWNGYGRSSLRGKDVLIHRAAYEMTVGPIPADMWVLHRCDNRACFRPSHLFLGDNTGNIRDRISKGRGNRRPAARRAVHVRPLGEIPRSIDLLRELVRHRPKGDACVEWTGTKFGGGYGSVCIGKRRFLAHRVAYEIAFGPILEGVMVCHRCDNRACVRVSHLFLGTCADNLQDCKAKGRQQHMRGELHGAAKLTEEQVREMRALRAEGWMLPPLAERYGVQKQQISRICRRERWLHVD